MGSDAKERLLSMNPWVDLDWPERCKQAAARIAELEAALSAATARAEAAEAEAARLWEAEMNAERFLANLDPENARDDSLLRDIHARLQRHGEKYPDRAVSVLHRNVVLYTIASVARAALGGDHG